MLGLSIVVLLSPVISSNGWDSDVSDRTLALRRPWSDQDTERLRQHIAAGGASRAAIIFRRTEPAVRAHARNLGLKFPTIRELRARAAVSTTAGDG